MRTVVWFRNDLRVADHPALFHAMERGEAVAVFCLCTRQWRSHGVGDNRLAFLLDSLHALARDLRALGVPLRLVTESWFDGVPNRLLNMAGHIRADAVAWNEEYPCNERARDARLTRVLTAAGIAAHVHHAGTIMPPGSVVTQAGAPYTVFTPFKRRWLARLAAPALEPLPVPGAQAPPAVEDCVLPDDIDGVPRRRVAARWPAGAGEAQGRLQAFLAERAQRYHRDRDFPAVDGTSTLSPYLAVGALSPRQCLHAAAGANAGRLQDGHPGLTAWINELIWRDFYRHVVAQFPHVSRGRSFRRDMEALPWRQNLDEFEAWKAGRTGYPLIDAAMRQLAETGWMHNRLRMVTAMFLAKHLLLDWRLGERHFMELLVDGDFAANNGGWQWSAATGTDAAPYFRIFNPNTQARRFDPQGRFIRRFVPELRDAPAQALFDPEKHTIPGYPRPIVAHKAARERALAAYRTLRR